MSDILADFGLDEPIKEKEEKEEKKKQNQYHWFFAMLGSKKYELPNRNEIDKINEYIFFDFMKNSPITIDIVYDLNFLNNVPFRIKYDIFMKQMKDKNQVFIPFSKKDEEERDILKVIQEVYNCNENIAKEYKEIMEKNETLNDFLIEYQEIYDFVKGKR